jgi:hypothetical protein
VGEFLFSVIFLTLIFVKLEFLQSLKLVKKNSFNDFVCKTPISDINYFQVAWLLSDGKTTEREFRSLEKIRDNYPKFLLTMDSFTQDRFDIKYLNVFSWLLANE